VRRFFFVITDQDPCQHIDQWPRKTRESTTATIYIIFNKIALQLINAAIIYNYCTSLNLILCNYYTSLSAIWCVMEHWKATLTKAEGRGQYCFSVLHNIQLLHVIECHMMCYGSLKSNIDQGRSPRSILLFSAP
jgi:hypothetical protein